MQARLIINADDYGRTPSVSEGIRFAHLNGIVTSTTAMMNMPNVVEDLRVAMQETPKLGLGVHLVLTCGTPLQAPEQVPSLVDENGNFLDLAAFTLHQPRVVASELRQEWQAQVERFVKVTGLAPTHLDSHHHTSYFSEVIFQVMLDLAREYGSAIRLPVVPENRESKVGMPPQLVPPFQEFAPRLLADDGVPYPDYFYGTFYDELATPEELLRIVKAIPGGTAEIMSHPGYIGEGLPSGYADQREVEIEVLTDPQVEEFIKGCGIELINFAGLSR